MSLNTNMTRGACLQPLLPVSPSIFCSKRLIVPFLRASKERMDVHITDLEDNIDFTVILVTPRIVGCRCDS